MVFARLAAPIISYSAERFSFQWSRSFVATLVLCILWSGKPVSAWPAEETPPQDTAIDSSSEPPEGARLSALAAKSGTDPTASIGFYQLSYGHASFTNSLRLDYAKAVVQLPLTPNWLIRAALPYVWADLNQPRGSTMEDGTTDMTVRVGRRFYASENVALYIGGDASFPTASRDQLGTGKYTLGPGGAVAVTLPQARSLFFLQVQDFNSIGGDPSRASIHYMQVLTTFNTFWSKRWWTSAVARWDIDWTLRRESIVSLQGEVGYGFDEHWKMFIRPGVGVAGKENALLGLDWSMEAGVRWVFKTPLLPETFWRGPRGK